MAGPFGGLARMIDERFYRSGWGKKTPKQPQFDSSGPLSGEIVIRAA
jgi:hypothetical protein